MNNKTEITDNRESLAALLKTGSLRDIQDAAAELHRMGRLEMAEVLRVWTEQLAEMIMPPEGRSTEIWFG